jgi:hypothetical protein
MRKPVSIIGCTFGVIVAATLCLSVPAMAQSDPCKSAAGIPNQYLNDVMRDHSIFAQYDESYGRCPKGHTMVIPASYSVWIVKYCDMNKQVISAADKVICVRK